MLLHAHRRLASPSCQFVQVPDKWRCTYGMILGICIPLRQWERAISCGLYVWYSTGELNYLKGISFPSENTSSNFTSSRVELISPLEFNKISKKIFSCQQNSSLIVYALCHCLKRKRKKSNVCDTLSQLQRLLTFLKSTAHHVFKSFFFFFPPGALKWF